MGKSDLDIKPEDWLFDVLKRDQYKEIVIFLGAGASMEGKLNGKPYPGFKKLIEEILTNVSTDWKYAQSSSSEEKFLKFKNIIKQWEKEGIAPKQLSIFLDGEPGPAHFYLAAITIVLYRYYNISSIHITTNYDDLMSKAFSDLERNKERSYLTKYFPLLRHITGSELKRFYANINQHIKDGVPVILKLFGDLHSQNPIFEKEDMTFEPETENQLNKWLECPIIFIGYSFQDLIIKELLISANSSAPVFVVDPKADILNLELSKRKIFTIKKSFSNFILDFLEVIQKKDLKNYEKITEILKPLTFQIQYPNVDYLNLAIRLGSKPSLLRVKEKLPKIAINENILPIDRKETAPDFQKFIEQVCPLMVIVGDSGMGKSTLLYKIATQEDLNINIISLFYDTHHLQDPGSLRKRLSKDFLCEEDRLYELLNHIDSILSETGKKLLVIIDGINESFQIEPTRLRAEIEELSVRLPSSIKIVFSCRKVYWESFIKTIMPTLPTSLYFNSSEIYLHRFSPSESIDAFKSYQDAYKFKGSYEDLREEIKDKIRDPLILRMLSEKYQEKDFPSYTPSVSIYASYEDALIKKFQNTMLMDFIYELVSSKVRDQNKNANQFFARTVRTDNNLSKLIQQQLNNPIRKGDPIVLLKDEGIITSHDDEKSTFCFVHDRFFEYLLGKEIGKQLETILENNFTDVLTDKILEYKEPFSFKEGLKSEVIRNNIINPDSVWSFRNLKTVTELLNSPHIAVKNFTKEVLRELIFEAEKDTMDALRKISHDELDLKLLALDIAGDSPKIKPILIEGLFSGDKIFARRCTQILSVRNLDTEVRTDFENSIVKRIAEIKHLDEVHAVGLIYYTAAIFSLEDAVNNDPFIQVKLFWKRILLAIDNNLETAMKKIKEIVSTGFTKLFKEEGPIFSGDFSQTDPMEYIWKDMSSETSKIRTAALKMIQLVIDPNQPINIDLQEVIRFFGSSIKDWEYRNEPEKSVDYNYEFEYRIAQWLLLHRSHHKYKEVKQILDQFVKTGFWKNIDFALCTMKYILLIIHKDNKEIIIDGFNVMKRWTEKFRENEDKFYSTLSKSDPFSINQIPISMTATIDTAFSYFSPEDEPVAYLKERLTSSNKNDVYLALLCVRDLWQNHPKKILSTLDTVANSEDIKINDWLGRILKEIYLVYPHFVEDFFYRNKMDPSKVQEIKNREDVKDSSGFEYSASPLLKQLFLSTDDRRKLFAEWYQKIFTYKNTESYCRDLVKFILKQILAKD